jgi:hypothetical protein
MSEEKPLEPEFRCGGCLDLDKLPEDSELRKVLTKIFRDVDHGSVSSDSLSTTLREVTDDER